MEAVTIHQEGEVQTQVIHVHAPYSELVQMITARRSEDGIKLTDFRTGSKARSVYLPSDAMTALVKLWGAGQESDTVARLQQQNEGYRAVITSDDKLIDRANEEIDRLRAQIAAMQSQEAFRVALLESVASAARAFQQEDTDLTQIGIWNALENLDAWQPDDASTDVSAEDIANMTDYEAAKHELRGAIADATVAPPSMPSLAYVHTQTVIENQRMKAVVEAAAIITASFSEGLMPTLGAMNELRDAVDSWQEDATRAMLSDDAEDMSAVPAKE